LKVQIAGGDWMKLLSFLGAIGLGIFAASWLASLQRRGIAVQGEQTELNGTGLNINEATEQEIMLVLGLDAETAERIVEHRPYPSRIDLLGRMVISNEVYSAIKDRIIYQAS
jgi:DNA uptake protein ComE-like DNA-binding protein